MKLLIVTCHLSTGGSVQYLLEYIKTIINDYQEIKVIEFTNFSSTFIIQKDKIKNLIGNENVICLGEYDVNQEVWYDDKMKLIDIMNSYDPDVIWMNEFPENYEYKSPPSDLMDYIYHKDRTYKLIETTHYNSFNFDDKKYTGDEFMFCSPSHIEKSKNIDIPKYLWEVPIIDKIRPDRNSTLESLGLDPSYYHILNVGLFNRNKNQKYIFDLANKMKKDKVMFHFIGNNCFFDECGITEEELSLRNYKIWGERNDVDVFMSCMDLYLFPSIKELSPITIREALSHQMDIIANRDEYVSQYTNYDNFKILDETDVISYIKKKLKKFLIVCSFYNKTEDQIKRTIDSVINQSYANWELILGDDLSGIDCSYIITQYLEEINDDRITFHIVEYKYELYLYQNFFKEREYDYYFDLDSDDIIDRNILDIYQRHFIKYPEVNSLFCDYKVVDQDNNLQRYGLVKPSTDLINDFNIRTYQNNTYMQIWEKCHSWSMFGVARCFRRSKFNCFEIDKRCKTATDSMVLFNCMIEGDHLHIPMDLYTYERRENSDSSVVLTQEESENYNVNTIKAMEKYKETSNKVCDVYDDIYLETSAIILSGFKKDISLITNITDIQLEKLNFLYNGEIKLNDLSCENIIIISNKTNAHPVDDTKNICSYIFFDNFNVPQNHSQIKYYLNNSREEFIKKISIDRYFHYFRHLITHKDKKIITKNNMINITEFDGIKVEINGDDNTKKYFVEFIDGDTGGVLFCDTISNNMWTKPNIKYFINWLVKVNGKEVYKQDLKGKRVLIEFGSSSLGDTLAWFPYLLEFKKKHECYITVLTFKNWLFEGLDIYSEFEFIKPGQQFNNIHKKYEIGWFLDINGEIDKDYYPDNFREKPLQQTACDILGIEHHQLRPSINMEYSTESPMSNKYVCIAIHSTAQAKYWNNPGGWQKVVDYLRELEYEVILISSEENGYMGNIHPHGITQINGSIEKISNYLKHCDFFIGISSGLSWLAWAVGSPIVLVSGFTEPYTEFLGDDIQRISNTNGCHGCFNTHKLDPSDWNWCPLHKGTDRQFECSKNITFDQVKKGIDDTLSYINK